jgi:hypothetical protein
MRGIAFFNLGGLRGPRRYPAGMQFAKMRCMSLRSVNPLNHGMADGIRRVGFRKWYERELLSSHAHLVLTVLSSVGLLGSFEAMRGAAESDRALNVLYVLLCIGIALWSLRRYVYLLTRAEDLANQANCESCGEYGRFTVTHSHAASRDTEVCCRRCAHKWVITEGE